MTKSRSGRAALLSVAALAASWPAPAFAQDTAIWSRPENALPDLEAARAAAAFENPHASEAARIARCDPGRGGEDVVVCGRRAGAGGGLRVPYEPVPGARIRVAGEVPSAVGALDAGTACIHLCYRPVMVDVLGAARAIGQGIDRLLHPD